VSVSAAPSRAAPIRPAALEQKVAQVLQRARDRHGRLPAPVLLVRAAPVWDGAASFQVGEWAVRVVVCVSPLAVLEQITAHLDAGDGSVLVVLTDREDSELGNGVLSQVLGQQVLTIEPWSLVMESFGAQRLDPRLVTEGWAAEALVDAMPPSGWPRLPGTVLNRDVALRHLAVRRLGLERLRAAAGDLDVQTLLRWSALPGAAGSLGSLRAEERQGLVGWLIELTGRAAMALFALAETGRGSDALALGLVCGALWAPAAQGATERSQGRVDQCFGDAHLDDDVVRAFAGVAEEVVTGLLDDSAGSGLGAVEAGRLVHAVLERAEELLVQLGAEDAARYSDVLRSGFEHRVGAVARALRAWLDGGDRGGASAALAGAVAALDRHRLAGIHRHRVERAKMAQRLVQWLDVVVEEPSSVGDGIGRQAAEWGWVDRALGHVWIGEDVNAELKAAYRAVYERASARRRMLDAAFARRLATWTAGGAGPGRMLTVEALLPRVVAPLVIAGERAALLVVLDGMSAAVASELAEELREQRWDEYDPLGNGGPEERERQARRRAVVAALPTVTTVSRMSLFAAELRQGGQDQERKAFEGHRLWRGRKARLFHGDTVRGRAGELLSDELTQALSDTDTLVAVVLNTIDDALDHGREGIDAGWRVADIGPLRELLDFARYHGRAVILTSDHGHVLEHSGELRPAAGILSARHRAGDGPVAGGEVELAGSRVVAPGGRVVALWDPRVRYAQRRAGYHGGASLAEVTIPLLAFLPLGAAAPRDWRPLADQHPAWWSLARAGEAAPIWPAAPPATPPSAPPPRRARKPAPAPAGQTALDLSRPGEPAAEPPPAPPTLVEALLESEMFAVQHGLTPRKVPKAKIRAAIAALLDANGVLPVAVLADRAGEQPARAHGFVTTLQRIFNLDNYPVLSLVDDGRTVRLDARLLREQFALKEATG
jgi:hypothetical protein